MQNWKQIQPDHGGEAAMFRSFCDLLVAHICFEEQQLLILPGTELKPAQSDAINKALQDYSVEDEECEDPFWE